MHTNVSLAYDTLFLMGKVLGICQGDFSAAQSLRVSFFPLLSILHV